MIQVRKTPGRRNDEKPADGYCDTSQGGACAEAQEAAGDGSRSLQEWTAARLDVTPQVARDLVFASRSITPALNDSLAGGEVSFDRAIATSRLSAAGASDRVIDLPYGHDLVGVARLTAAHRRMEPGEEQEVCV